MKPNGLLKEQNHKSLFLARAMGDFPASPSVALAGLGSREDHPGPCGQLAAWVRVPRSCGRRRARWGPRPAAPLPAPGTCTPAAALQPKRYICRLLSFPAKAPQAPKGKFVAIFCGVVVVMGTRTGAVCNCR